MSALRIRPYRAEDRAAVRHICHATGFMGEPADWYWRDAESFAEVWSGYYTDREPESAFVVEDAEGRVVGYLLGCVDTRRAPDPARRTAQLALVRGLLARPGTAGFLWRALGDVLTGSASSSSTPVPERYPAHLHIDLLPEARGRGAGRALVACWLERLRGLGAPGCHLGTLAENRGAVAFFERMGFRRHGAPCRVPGLRSRAGARLHAQTMVREL